MVENAIHWYNKRNTQAWLTTVTSIIHELCDWLYASQIFHLHVDSFLDNLGVLHCKISNRLQFFDRPDLLFELLPNINIKGNDALNFLRRLK